MLNRARFNGARFNSFGVSSILFSPSREPTFRVLLIDVQDFAFRFPIEQFGIRVPVERNTIAVPQRMKRIDVVKDD